MADLARLSNLVSILANDSAVMIKSLNTSSAYMLSDVPYDKQSRHPLRKLDIYMPRQPFPRPLTSALCFIHGGAWIRGDKDYSKPTHGSPNISATVAQRLYANVGYGFAALGITTFIPNYRLSPEVQHPGHMHDVAAACAWVSEHAKKYGADGRQKLFLAGHSAGAHLLALAACTPAGLSPILPPMRGLIGLCGVYDLLRLADAPLGSALVSSAFGPRIDAHGMRDRWACASPVHACTSESPIVTAQVPLLLVNAEEDAHLNVDAAEFELAVRSARGGIHKAGGTRDTGTENRGLPGDNGTLPGPRGKGGISPQVNVLGRKHAVWHSPGPGQAGYDGISRCTIPQTSHFSIAASLGEPDDPVTLAMATFIAEHGGR